MREAIEAEHAQSDEEQLLPHMQELLLIMQTLRDPQTGCPWDLEQTMETLIPYTIEETYEVADAIMRGDMHEIKDELGDLLFQVVFYAQLASEQEAFSFDEVAATIAEKLVRRHPHVFAEGEATSSAEVLQQWEQIKRQERADKPSDPSVFSGIPENLPALLQAQKIQKRCASVGFDWPDGLSVLAKVQEELGEIADVLTSSPADIAAVEEEIGDLMFATVNLARHFQVNPEMALRRANQKFMQRFRTVEKYADALGKNVGELDIEALEQLWQKVKSTEKRN